MKKFRDWVESVEFYDNDPNSLYKTWKNVKTGEKGSVLRGQEKQIEKEQNSKLDNKEQLQSFSNSKKPRVGDRAYSRYHGIEGEGILWSTNPNENRHFHLLALDKNGFPTPNNPWFAGPNTQLSVGYDEPIVWDSKRGMFYAPADRD